MTTTKTLAVLKEICSLAGLNVSETLPLHQHAATLYLFEAGRLRATVHRLQM